MYLCEEITFLIILVNVCVRVYIQIISTVKITRKWQSSSVKLTRLYNWNNTVNEDHIQVYTMEEIKKNTKRNHSSSNNNIFI